VKLLFDYFNVYDRSQSTHVTDGQTTVAFS